MEFGLTGRCFSEYPWNDFLQAALQLGVEAIELDTQPNAHCGTWSPDLDPEPVVEQLKSHSLRVGGLSTDADLVQSDPSVRAREAEKVRAALGLAYRYRSEVVRLPPQRPKRDMSREEMLNSILEGCRAFLGEAEESGMLVCLQPDRRLLNDADTLNDLFQRADSFNLKAAVDPYELLRASGSEEGIRTAIGMLIQDTAHACLRDGRPGSGPTGATEVPVGQGVCPVEMVVSELMAVSYHRPFYVEYRGEGDVFDSVKEGINYFRDLPNRLLAEAGIL